ncbi:MAG: hemin uptake protein HemP [Shimia sp.]
MNMQTTMPKDATPAPIDADDILRGETTARIALGDQVYVLRLTKSGKLILNK